MDIKEQWQKLEQAKFNQETLNKQQIMDAIKLESTSTVAELKKRLGQKINWIKFFLVMFAANAIYNYQNVGIILLMTVAALCYIGGYIALQQNYNQLKPEAVSSLPVLEGMKINLSAIKNALKSERIFGLITLPIALVIGLSYSKVARGHSIPDILETSFSLSEIIGILVIVVGLGALAEWMNKIAFKKQIDQLQGQISDIEKIS